MQLLFFQFLVSYHATVDPLFYEQFTSIPSLSWPTFVLCIRIKGTCHSTQQWNGVYSICIGYCGMTCFCPK
uniref:Uncharacterized protein n=1 Tax=Arundo donax TaxID=35708 RepID=A0A0A9GGW5_ARUDO